MVRSFLLPALLTAFYWTYSRLWFIRHIRRPSLKNGIYAHWHGDELVLVGAFSRRGMAVLSSKSRDGEMMQRFLTWMGYHVRRGSSSRGGAGGLKGLIDAVKNEGREASLAVDGPRGPRGVVKPGILALAQATTGQIIPGASAATRKYVFKSAWNRCYLPSPLATCFIVYGEPLAVPATATEEELEALRLKLETTLHALKAEAEQLAESPNRISLKSISDVGV